VALSARRWAEPGAPDVDDPAAVDQLASASTGAILGISVEHFVAAHVAAVNDELDGLEYRHDFSLASSQSSFPPCVSVISPFRAGGPREVVTTRRISEG
jgi:hypothetical protein